MSMDERTGRRSLLYSRWHRTLPPRVTMIDVDGLEYCERCMAPLALIEIAEGFTWDKNTVVTRKLAERAGIPAYLLLYERNDWALYDDDGPDWANAISRFRVAEIHPGRTDHKPATPDEIAELLTRIHDDHHC